MSARLFRTVSLPLIAFLSFSVSHAASYKYIRMGQKSDAQTKPVAGIAMMGGGTDLDEAFRWLCEKANGKTS